MAQLPPSIWLQAAVPLLPAPSFCASETPATALRAKLLHTPSVGGIWIAE
jgi:hypothetical protein